MPLLHNYAIPEPLLPFAGRIMDADAHENTPINHWVDRFGAIAADMADAYGARPGNFSPPHDKDDTELTPHTVWNVKKSPAPGAFDMKRRVEVMDMMGVRRQLLFPGSMALSSLSLFYLADNPNFMPNIAGDRRAYAFKVAKAHNDWCVRQQRETERIVPVALLLAQTPEELLEDARKLLNSGVRAFWVPSAILLAGASPAAPVHDKFYETVAAANACLTIHPAGDLDSALLRTNAWREIPAFQGFKLGEELPLDPWSLVNLARAAEVFVSTLVLGGVFERHPTLRFCVSENSADWIGPLSYRMDMWMKHMKFIDKVNVAGAKGQSLPTSMLPSEFVNRNVRVAVFDFEDVGGYISRFGLEDVYMFASDYPHPEGGVNPMGLTYQSLMKANVKPEVIEKFYVSNGNWVMPN